jgi:hypothetical protein
MARGKPRLIKDLLADRGGLAGIAERAAATDRLSRRVQSALPGEVSNHILGANISGDSLVVIVDGAAWAARVRFESRAIRRVLSDTQEIDVARVIVRVRPPI